MIRHAGCVVQRQRAWPTSYLPALHLHKPRHDAALKVLFFETIWDLGLIDTVPSWYSPIKPQSVYETTEVQAYWDVPVYGEYQEHRANRVDARIVNNREKQVVALEMHCPWVSRVRDQPVQYHLRCTRGWSKDLDVTLQKLVGSKAKGVLKKMQMACQEH